jgi:hypothetical protein
MVPSFPYHLRRDLNTWPRSIHPPRIGRGHFLFLKEETVEQKQPGIIIGGIRDWLDARGVKHPLVRMSSMFTDYVEVAMRVEDWERIVAESVRQQDTF